MKFYPEDPNDENVSQLRVWTRLREAFTPYEGVAYYEYPISFPDGFKRYALDALLVLRHDDGRFGAYVFETKGCRTQNIAGIHGSEWVMQDWHSERESPQRQVDHHKFAFQKVTQALLGPDAALDVIGFVALPRVTRAEWQARGFDRLPGVGNVLLQEDLEPGALRARLADAAQYARSLNAEQWTALQRGLGGGAEPDPIPEGPTYPDRRPPAPGQLTLVTYAGQTPSDQDLRTHLFEEEGEQIRPYTYLVATSLLAQQREHLAPDHQRGEQGPHLMFKRAVRYFLTSRQIRMASRSEEQVLLGRALKAAAGNHPGRQAQLRQDLFRWQKAFAELAERGADVSGGFLNQRVQPLTPQLGQIMQSAQPLLMQAAQQAQPTPTPTFEMAAHAYFASEHYRPTPVIYMEGFTFLTPLQHHFIHCSLARGANVYLIYPNRASQEDGYAVMADTYQRFDDPSYGPVRRRTLRTAEPAGDSDLRQVQAHLFSDTVRVPQRNDGTLNLQAYSHLHEEVNGALRLVQGHLASGKKASDLVLVTRDPDRYRAVLSEQADLLGIELNLSLPPRALLLTPTGRFILTLYDIWRGGDLQVTPEQVESVLRSGWLGGPARVSARTFADVQPQFFDRCRTPEDWVRAFQDLRTHLREGAPVLRSPASVVTQEQVILWEGVLGTVTDLSRRLFSSSERSIGAHVQHLLRELDALPTAQTMDEERELLQALRSALEELATLSSLSLNGEEFGEVISGLVRQREGGTEPDEESPPQKGKVAVVAPESLDGATRSVVVYLGVDHRKVPRLNPSAWPFQDPHLHAQQLKERYLFLAVIRAATDELHLSYALADEREQYTPSIFLTDVARLSNREIPVFRPPVHAPAKSLTAPAPPTIQRSTYSLDEVFHFGLCPARYRLERLSPSSRVYNNAFQITFLAQGHWLDEFWTSLTAHPATLNLADLTAAFEQARTQAEPRARQAFPGLRDLAWRGVSHQINRELHQLTERIEHYQGEGPVRLEPGFTAQHSVKMEDSTSRDVVTQYARQIRRGYGSHPDTSDATQREWLIPGARAQEDDTPHREVDGIQLFATQYHAYRAWLDARKAVYYNHLGRAAPDLPRVTAELNRLITAMERGHYPKAPGDHCAFCPVQRPCLPTLTPEGL
ncbi:nuclease-related domain-containing protein [Deinococcus knuensis]|uniref:PD-(D/E)XK endonuclease-like domain-containing protein n=1 Tax=Deinococcus knuensis TaxID=1837380 RepID=A0ABQ2STF4_9DEIO|nr:nuclease-related domain-containing protein [Deinococcus knuensis]GGS37507.1 hypothetical protein GCM10008961_31340 [Deinococcus knuensis]